MSLVYLNFLSGYRMCLIFYDFSQLSVHGVDWLTIGAHAALSPQPDIIDRVSLVPAQHGGRPLLIFTSKFAVSGRILGFRSLLGGLYSEQAVKPYGNIWKVKMTDILGNSTVTVQFAVSTEADLWHVNVWEIMAIVRWNVNSTQL